MSDAAILPEFASGTQILDVRPTLQAGGEPFSEIMQALNGLKPGQGLAIRAIFEPAPLMGIFAAKGYSGVSHRLADDDWIIDFQPAAAGPAPKAAEPAPKPADADADALDVRGLEPPEPLLRIIAAGRNLAPGATLKILHERRPSLLYPKLDELGLTYRTEELAEDVFHIYVTRPARSEA